MLRFFLPLLLFLELGLILFTKVHVSTTQITSFVQANLASEGQETEENISQRFKVPMGYQRVSAAPNSFAAYLRQLKLKPRGSQVQFYNGGYRQNYGSYLAVVDMSIGDKDLQQCADAVIRLRAEWLYQNKEFNRIQFRFTNGHLISYAKWIEGYRIQVQGNKSKWVASTEAKNDRKVFWEYLETIFMYAGTHSLSKELKSVPYNKMQIGDVLIQGGFPGHAVIVVDMCEELATGKKKFILAQSYMPAQEIHILSSSSSNSESPWYDLESDGNINTPDWFFTGEDLKRFPLTSD